MPNRLQLHAKFGMLAVTAMMIAGCDAVKDDASPPAKEVFVPQTSTIEPPPLTLGKRKAKSMKPPLPPEGPKPPAPAQAPDSQPAELVGLDEQQVIAYLGDASSTREVPPATVWEYRVEDCRLDLFFYMDLADQRFRTLAYEIKASDDRDPKRALTDCVNLIRQRTAE